MQSRTKKWVGMILVGSMLLGVFAACSKQSEGSQQSQTAQAEQTAAAAKARRRVDTVLV